MPRAPCLFALSGAAAKISESKEKAPQKSWRRLPRFYGAVGPSTRKGYRVVSRLCPAQSRAVVGACVTALLCSFPLVTRTAKMTMPNPPA